VRTGPFVLVLLATGACRGPDLTPDTDGPWDGDDSGLDTANFGGDDDSGATDVLPHDETEAREFLLAKPIDLIGRALTPEGLPIVGATAFVADRFATTDAEGWFRFDDLRRHNQLVRIEAEGRRPHSIPAWLLRPVEIELVTLEAVSLESDDPNTVRFLFGGDMAFGRRYLDPDEGTPWTSVPPSDPLALIDTSNPLPGTRAILAEVAPYFADADYPIVNLESVVTDRPLTPHPTKYIKMAWSAGRSSPAAYAMPAGATPNEITSASESSSRPIGEATCRHRARRPSRTSKTRATGTRIAAQ